MRPPLIERCHPRRDLNACSRRERWWERRPRASKPTEIAGFYFRPRTLHPPLSKPVAVKLAVKNFAQERFRLSISRTRYRLSLLKT